VCACTQMQDRRNVIRLSLLLLPALLLALCAWLYLLLGPGTTNQGFDLGAVLLCLFAQTLALGWALAASSVYVCKDLRATLVSRHFFDLDRLREILASHKVYLEPSSSSSPTLLLPSASITPVLDSALQEYEMVQTSGRRAGQREVALAVLFRVSKAGQLTEQRKEQLILLVSELCLLCGESLAIGQRDSEALEPGLREMLRRMRHDVQRQREETYKHLLQEPEAPTVA
jgi:hypothetical protein